MEALLCAGKCNFFVTVTLQWPVRLTDLPFILIATHRDLSPEMANFLLDESKKVYAFGGLLNEKCETDIQN